MVRTTLTGEELEGFDEPAPTQHVKLVVPYPGADRPVLPDPEAGPDGPKPLMRTLTVRRFDPERQELEIDFAIHGHGPVSSWAASAKPGDVVALAGPGGRKYEIDPDAEWYLLAGDETAIPAMATLLEGLPASMPVEAYVEVADAAEELTFETQGQPRVTWLHRASNGQPAGRLLARTLGELPPKTGNGRIWLACEAMVMRDIRKLLLGDWGLNEDQIVTRGYWHEGDPNYRDSDYGQEEAPLKRDS